MKSTIVKQTVSFVRVKTGYVIEVEVEDKQGMIHGTHVERATYAYTTFREALQRLALEFKGIDDQAEEIYARLAKEGTPCR